MVTASELIPGFCRSKANVPGSLRTVKSPTAGIVPGIKSPPLARTPPPPTGLTLIGALCGTREGLAALVTFRQRLTNSQYASTHPQYTCAQKLCEPREDGGCRQGETIFSRTCVTSFERKKLERNRKCKYSYIAGSQAKGPGEYSSPSR